jgi:hypothetical protein
MGKVARDLPKAQKRTLEFKKVKFPVLAISGELDLQAPAGGKSEGH